VSDQNRFPPGWDEARVRRVLAHDDGQTDDEVVAEDEAAYEPPSHAAMGYHLTSCPPSGN